MGEVRPEPVGVLLPTVNPCVNGGSSDVLTTCVVQPIDSTKVPQNTFEKNARGEKWDFEEDMALMSAWCVVSDLQFRNKNKKKMSLWAHVKTLYDEAHAQNPKKLGPRNDDQMRGRWKRLNENAIKWIDAYRKAYRQKTFEVSLKDIENEAHKIYAASGKAYNDIIVFNGVMSKHPKWDLCNDHKNKTTPCKVGNDESGGSTKRARTYEEGDFCVVYNQETPNSGGSTTNHAYKKKEKCKVSQSSLFLKEFVVQLCATRITIDSEVEVVRKRLELEHKKEERKSKKVYYTHLNTLLAKEHLSPEDKDMKHHLWAMLYEK